MRHLNDYTVVMNIIYMDVNTIDFEKMTATVSIDDSRDLSKESY